MSLGRVGNFLILRARRYGLCQSFTQPRSHAGRPSGDQILRAPRPEYSATRAPRAASASSPVQQTQSHLANVGAGADNPAGPAESFTWLRLLTISWSRTPP